MHQGLSHANPFSLLLDPERVIRAVESSERLARLRSRIYHPLDEIRLKSRSSPCVQFDRWVDQMPDDPEVEVA
jgi:hypothetical protein